MGICTTGEGDDTLREVTPANEVIFDNNLSMEKWARSRFTSWYFVSKL